MQKEYPYFMAAISKDIDNLENSSSGGMFYELCKHVIEQQGIVYGVAQTGVTKVEHQRAEDIIHAEQFRRSKYLRSQLKDCYIQARQDLEDGKLVMFSGVGCQIAGLYKYLNKAYKNLITCEVVCHGAPLTEALEKYIAEKEEKTGDKISWINFRDKSRGWKDNCLAEYYMSGKSDIMLSQKHPVHSLYLQGINMESQCSLCKYAKLPRVADITLADFWQYKGDIPHNGRGISLVAVNTIAGELLLNAIEPKILFEFVTKEAALSSCRHMTQAPLVHKSNKAFKKLIRTEEFQMAYNLCHQFGEVVVAEELCQKRDLSEEQVFKIFEEDTQEVIYCLDEKNRVRGIVTYGYFITHYGSNDKWISEKFCSVRLSDNPVLKIQKIFDEYSKINRIPVLDDEGCLIYEVRRVYGANGKEDTRKLLIPFAKLSHNGNKSFFVKRPDLLEDISVYKENEVRRIKEGVSFPVMQGEWEKYIEDFIDIFGEDITEEYVRELCEIPPIIVRGDRYQHLDGSSQCVNVVNGCRVTVGQPAEHVCIIHVYGRCGVFGYAVEDKNTFPSALQKILNENKINIKVVNHGLWGADDAKILNNMLCDINSGIIGQQDIVVVYMDFLPWMEELRKLSVLIYDSTLSFHDFLKGGATFFDRPGHMTAEGYQFIAEYVYEKMQENESFVVQCADEKRSRVMVQKYDSNGEIKEYLAGVKEMLPMEQLLQKKVGAIVMNCNPFTKGHRFLIEEALNKVDIIIIFVLEENSSYFSFEDRYQMVKMGTADLENVYVIPSGKFIISTITFPEYFLKEQNPSIKINAAADVEIFGGAIAPDLNIVTRFVGTEPTDNVTGQYNEELKKVLPGYGIEVYEIPRLKSGDKYVTATEVRECIKTGRNERLPKLLPETTINYLRNSGIMKG